MPVYRKQDLTNLDPPDVPLAGLRGGRPAKQQRFHAVHSGIDKVPAMGRRVLLTNSAAGSTTWQADTSNPSSTINRIVAQGRADLTPGSMLAMSAMWLPSGDQSGGDGPRGEVQLDVTWTDQASNDVSTTHVLTLTNGPDQLEDPWEGIRVGRIPLITPVTLTATDTLAVWSRHVAVNMTLSYNGNPRILDVCVHEVPYQLALEEDDDDTFWVSSFFNSPGPNLAYPIQRFSETTPDGNRLWGTFSLMDAAKAQALRLGPCLFSWSGHANAGDSATVVNDSYQTINSGTTTWVRIPDGTSSTTVGDLIGDDDIGWGMESGAYAKPPAENPDASMGNTGSIPVRVFVLAGGGETDDQDFVFRIYTAPYDYVEITGTAPIESSDPEWFMCYGHLRCGKGPGDPVTAHAVARRTTTDDDLRIYAIEVYKSGQYARAV